MIEKVAKINKIREKKSAELVAKGGTALDPYTFDYLLLCNKICGASHYNMQMKVVVDTPADYKKWLNEKTTLVQEVKAANAPAPAPSVESSKDSTKTVVAETMVDAKIATK